MVVPTLQSLLLRIVPTAEIVENNLIHMLSPVTSRFAQEMDQCGSIPQWLLCQLLDAGNTSYFCFHQFIHGKAHRLPLNKYVKIGHQESHDKQNCSMEMYAMRVSMKEVFIYIYSNPYVDKHGYMCRNDTIPQDLSSLRLDCVFAVSSAYKPKGRMKPTYDELFSTDTIY